MLTSVKKCSSIEKQSRLTRLQGDGPLAQLAEHLTFNQVVRSSNLRWLTIIYFMARWSIG